MEEFSVYTCKCADFLSLLYIYGRTTFDLSWRSFSVSLRLKVKLAVGSEAYSVGEITTQSLSSQLFHNYSAFTFSCMLALWIRLSASVTVITRSSLTENNSVCKRWPTLDPFGYMATKSTAILTFLNTFPDFFRWTIEQLPLKSIRGLAHCWVTIQ